MNLKSIQISRSILVPLDELLRKQKMESDSQTQQIQGAFEWFRMDVNIDKAKMPKFKISE